MAIPYVVRKKVYTKDKEIKELWFATVKKIQQKGGMTDDFIARRVSERTGISRGLIEGIISEIAEAIEFSLGMGFSVTIDKLGSFQTALTSKGFENPTDITPEEVELSRIYFIADRKLTQRVREEGCFQIPFESYMPKEYCKKKAKRNKSEATEPEE